MKNQNAKSKAQNLVNEILTGNNPNAVRELTLNADYKTKQKIVASIRKLDMTELSTTPVCS